jgi:hypothetical protein
MDGMQFGQIDPTRLVQPLELPLVMAMVLRAQQPRNGQRTTGKDQSAARELHRHRASFDLA